MAVKRVQLIVSEAGLNALMTAGITTGWISVWLQSAGFDHVELHLLESDAWQSVDACQVFIASHGELMGVVAYFNNNPDFADGKQIKLKNPDREVLLYHCKYNVLQAILIPIGDISYQRGIWLQELADGRQLQPLNIWIGEDEAGIGLEPGLRGSVGTPPKSGDVLNVEGLLPEEHVFQLLEAKKLKVRFAESCTGGGMSERLSRMPGASAILDKGWVTYSNLSKQEMLDVPGLMLQKCGAVSREVVEAMAAYGSAGSHVCVAVSGIAGPDGGSNEKPVGTVWLAVAIPGCRPLAKRYIFSGSRAEVRARSVLAGFSRLVSLLSPP